MKIGYVGCVLALALCSVAQAPKPPTVVADTIVRENGQPSSLGRIFISWQAFTTAEGVSVKAGKISVPVSLDGAFSVALVPNLGASPAGSYYLVEIHPEDGSSLKEWWVIPPSSTPIKIQQAVQRIVKVAGAVL